MLPIWLMVMVAALTCATAGDARPAGQDVAAHVPQPLCGALSGQPSAVSHVIVIVMENHSYDELIGPIGSAAAARAPYLNGTLKRRCGLATNYHAITHPSLPNYIAMVAGSTGGISSDCTSCTTSASSLFGQLRRNARSWRVFAESMPSYCSSTGT